MTAELNSLFMYLVAGGIILFVALVCVIFMVRAYRAGKAIGMEVKVLKRTITSSATFSVLPAVAILLGVITLSGSLGTPWPWLRLSVIGALHYEMTVANGAAQFVGLGKDFTTSSMTPQAFSTIALLMSVCIMWGMILSALFNKGYLKRLGRKKKNTEAVPEAQKKPGFGDAAMTAMFIGLVSAFVGSYIGDFVSGKGLFTFAGDWKPVVVAAVSAGAMAIFTFFTEKKKMSFLEGFSIAGSMIIGMLSILLFR